MGLNIKNVRVHDLARRAAHVTGKTQTGAIEEALERLLAAYGEDPAKLLAARKVARVTTLVDVYLATPSRPDRDLAGVEDLYDEATGLPR